MKYVYSFYAEQADKTSPEGYQTCDGILCREKPISGRDSWTEIKNSVASIMGISAEEIVIKNLAFLHTVEDHG